MTTIKEVVEKHILEVLEQCKYNRRQAAEILGKSIRSLDAFCKAHGIPDRRYKSEEAIMRNVTPYERDRQANRER